MRQTFIVGTIALGIFAAASTASLRVEAMTIGSPAGLSAAIQETTTAQDVAGYRYYPYGYYHASPRSYYRYVCRAWWKGCGWEPGHYWNYWPNRYYRPNNYRYHYRQW